MSFWPVIVVAGVNFVGVFWDHNVVKPVVSETVCEKMLPKLYADMPKDKQFKAQLELLTGGSLKGLTISPVCINKTPQQYQEELERRLLGDESDKI